MSLERKDGDLARRPYYVVAHVPASLLRALQVRQGFDTARAAEMLRVLGSRGIGLAALNAHGGTQESAAAGFFYALQLFLPPSNQPAPQISSTGEVLGLLPVDPLESILEALAGREFARRADLLAITLRWSPSEGLQLCFVPVEVKHHGMPAEPEPIPNADDSELTRARQQLVQTAQVIGAIRDAVSSPTDSLAGYLKRVGLATLLDLAMSFSPVPPAPAERSAILKSALSGRVRIGIGDAVLMWFAPGSAQSSGGPCVIDRYGPTTSDGVRIREIYLDPGTVPGLWWATADSGPNEQQVRTQVDSAIQAAFSGCTVGGSAVVDILPGLRSALGFSSQDLQPRQAAEGARTAVGSRPTSTEASRVNDTADAEDARADISEPVVPATTEPVGTAAVTTPSGSSGHPVAAPRAFIGWSEPTSRWSIIGKLVNSHESVALDLDHPKTIGIFGYMGSGKSYLLGDLIEAAVLPMRGINALPLPLASLSLTTGEMQPIASSCRPSTWPIETPRTLRP
jgi:hypothetical protein